MFVSIVLDMGNQDGFKDVADLLLQYGFERKMKNVFESNAISDMDLARLKRDIDRKTDFYDAVRMFQFPVEGTLAITVLKENKWKRLMVRRS
jgi:CRISPR-associated protein Cas2